MKRSLANPIKEDLNNKIVFLTGPRQTGKTTLSKMLFKSYEYYNHDLSEHRVALVEKNWDRKKDLIIFDELHKKKNWKTWIKGIYDTEGARPRLLVTGSAKLDISKKMGDSLAGRFFQFRLHPFDLKELKGTLKSEEIFNRLINISGFPEPFLKGKETFYKRWKKSHLDIILRQDLLDLENVRNIQSIETLIEILRYRVGSPVSYNSLSNALEKSPKTIKRWLTILENLYIVFKVTPYHKNIARSLLKEPKYFFYDTGHVLGDKGAKLENLVAASLLKELDFLEDTLGYNASLHYLRNKDGREIDFLVLIDNKPSHAIEVKWADDQPSPHFKHFSRFFKCVKKVQLVKELKKEKTYPDGLEIRKVVPWLEALSLDKE